MARGRQALRRQQHLLALAPLELHLGPELVQLALGLRELGADPLRLRFGLPTLADPRRAKWILIDVTGRGVALCVDRVTEVFGTAGADLKPAPALGSGDDLRGIAGVVSRSDGLTFILDVGEFDVLTSPLMPGQLTGASEARR